MPNTIKHLTSLVLFTTLIFSVNSSADNHFQIDNHPAGLTQSEWQTLKAQINQQGGHLDEPKSIVNSSVVNGSQDTTYIKASYTESDEWFGGTVAISGDTLVVGARQEDSNSTGVDGDALNNLAPSSGAAFVFIRSNDTWVQQAYLKASNTDAGDLFGSSVDISGDTIVIGAYGEASNAMGINGNQTNNSAEFSGAAYVFTRENGVWSQQAYLKASNAEANDQFGTVSIAGDTVIVGAVLEDSGAVGINGNQLSNSGSNSGAAYVFTRSSGIWSQQAYIKASNSQAQDYFSTDLAISGDTFVVGARLEDSDATGVGGNQWNDSASASGAAYVFVLENGLWSQQAYLKASNTEQSDAFGWSVDVSGDTIVIGAINEDSMATGVNSDQSDNSFSSSGAAYVFTRSNQTWSQQAYLKASNTGDDDRFGGSVSIEGESIIVGSIFEDGGDAMNQADNTATNSGAAYLFKRVDDVWSQQSYIKASNLDAYDWFGFDVAIEGDTIVSGAMYERSNATGINGNQLDNSLIRAGAVYVSKVTYNLSGFVTGLQANNTLTLQNNGGDDLLISNNGAYLFATPLSNGASYNVTILEQPEDQHCAFLDEVMVSGTINGENADGLNIECIDTYSVGGNVSGLSSGNGVTLQNNMGDDLVVNSNNPAFEFSTRLFESEAYTVTVSIQPTEPDQTCSVSGGNSGNDDGSGTIITSDVTGIAISCNTVPLVFTDNYMANEDSTLIADDIDGSTSDANDDGVLVNDLDGDGDELYVVSPGTYVTSGIGGTIDITSAGTFTYTAPLNLSGMANFDYEISDGINTVQASLNIQVMAVNDPPSFDIFEDVDVTNLIDLNNNQIFIKNFVTNIVLGPADESAQNVNQFDLVVSDLDSILNDINIDNEGNLSLDFSLNYGMALIEVTLQDDGGTANGGVDRSSVVEFIVINLDLIFDSGFEPLPDLDWFQSVD